jgi:hypothetical protein
LEKLLMLVAKRGGVEKRRAYLNTVLAANAGALREVRDMYMTQELRDVILEIGIVDDLLDAAKREGEQRGVRIGEQKGEQRGMQIGEQRGMQIGEQRGMQIGEQRGMQIGEQRGMQIGEVKGAAGVLDLIDNGYTAEEIRKMLAAGVLPRTDKI